MNICVVHLVWKPLGPKYLERFLTSYRRFPGGREHTLAVLFNGFEGEHELSPYHDLLRDVEHRYIFLPGPRQDIAAYLEAARQCLCDALCFLNSYSEVLDESWLAKLHSHATRPSVGLVGVTGSYESRLIPRPKLACSVIASLARHPRSRLQMLRGHRDAVREWKSLRRDYDPFPSPHLRTNGFLIARETLLGLRLGPVETKEDALFFESGRGGLTRQVLRRGLQVLVVGRDGRGYAPGEWFESRTFRSGGQSNLLIADNRTRQFAEASPPEQAMLSQLAWAPELAMT